MNAVINPVKNDFSDIKHAAAPFATLSEYYGEALAAEQLALEHEAYELGEKRFLKVLDRQAAAGELADNVVARPLIGSLLPRMADRFGAWMDEQEWTTDETTGERTKKRGKRTPAFALLQHIKAEPAALITLKVVLGSVAESGRGNNVLQATAIKLGKAVEDECRFGRIRELEAKHFKENVQNNLKKRIGIAYKKAFMQIIEADMVSKKMLNDSPWESWTNDGHLHVGIKLIEMLIESTGLVQLVRNNAGNVQSDCQALEVAPEYVEILSKRAGALAGISPIHQPCVVPPRPWVDSVGGGYWAAGRRPLDLVRTHSKKAQRRYAEVDMPEVIKAVNIAQNTPWKINKPVLDVINQIVNWKNCPVSDIPALERGELPERPEDIDTNEESRKVWRKAAAAVYRKDKARISRRISMEFSITQANKFAEHEAIWFPYNMDWRGRVYAVPMFNPQGNDLTKGVLTLANGKPIGVDGLYWLKIHGSNCAGVDKVPFAERIKFIESNHNNIMESAADPLNNLWWAEQDSPFCFLAFCFEYANVAREGLNYVCSLPLAFDGSCSGIQHFSAMLRDEVGGRAVNLLPSDTVQDIYGIVSTKVIEVLLQDLISGTDNYVDTVTDKASGDIVERLKLGTKALAKQWLDYGVTRSVTKRSVMTLAYGSKEFGFRQQVLEDTIQPAIDAGKGMMFTSPNEAAGYMAKLIWNAVSVTVVAAVEAMKWLQSAAKLLAAEVKDKKTGAILRNRCAVHWVTPDGFPVWQEYKKPQQKRLDLIFLGQFRLQPTYNTNKDSGIDAHKQESGIAPNFVHSQDGSHLRMTVVHAHEAYGIESFSLIHDSFGTIPADAGNLFKAVRETMVKTYEECDVIQDFYEQFADQLHESQLDKMPAIPAKGSLNLKDILESDFAFA